MAKSKAQLVADYVALGGNRTDFPEDLDAVTAKEIEEKLEPLQLQAELNSAEQSTTSTTTQPDAATTTAPEAAKTPAADGPDKSAATNDNNGAGVLFTLTGAASYSSAAFPGRKYEAGISFLTDDEEEIAFVRSSGLFKEGE